MTTEIEVPIVSIGEASYEVRLYENSENVTIIWSKTK